MVILKSSIDRPRKGKSMGIMAVGIDLAKNIFAVHSVDNNGKAVLIKPKVSRDQHDSDTTFAMKKSTKPLL